MNDANVENELEIDDIVEKRQERIKCMCAFFSVLFNEMCQQSPYYSDFARLFCQFWSAELQKYSFESVWWAQKNDWFDRLITSASGHVIT